MVSQLDFLRLGVILNGSEIEQLQIERETERMTVQPGLPSDIAPPDQSKRHQHSGDESH